MPRPPPAHPSVPRSDSAKPIARCEPCPTVPRCESTTTRTPANSMISPAARSRVMDSASATRAITATTNGEKLSRQQRRSLFTYLSELIIAHTRGDPFPALT